MYYHILQPNNPTFETFTKTPKVINVDEYHGVYADDIDDNGDDIKTLEELFIKFNINHPTDFKGHSLSVGDVVILQPFADEETDIGKRHIYRAYVCASMGWERVELFDPLVNH